MSVNKVTAFGENLIDLTEDTVTKDTLIKGVTAHDASGNSVTGTFDTDKYLEKAGDASNTTAVFSASKERANISTGEKLSVIFGKIAKFFSDLKTVAFTGNYSDLSGTPSVVSKTADGLCPKNGGTTTKFLRDDGTYAVPTSSAIGLSTLEQVTAAATAGNVTAPVGAGALAEVNSSLGGFTPVIDSTGKITGYKTKAGADTVFPFKGEITSGEAWCKSMEHYRATYGGSLTHFDMDFTNIKSFTIALVNPQSYSYRHYIKLYNSNDTEIKDITITTTPVTFSDANIFSKAKKIVLYFPNATDYSFSYETK